VLGLLLLIAVLGTVLAFSTGTINALIAGTSPVSQGGVVMPGTSQPATSTVRLLAGSTPQSTVTSTPEPNATGDTTPTRTPTPTVSPTASPTTSPTATVTPTLEPTVVVPDLRNQPEVEARSALIRLDLTPVNDDEPRNDTTVPAGNVLDQAVPAGSTVRQGERITYTLSLGPQLVDVPNLIQVSLSYAQQEAERLGLSVQVSEEPSATVSEGFVINQRPNPGSRVQPGDTLFLSVSVGDKIRFPQVIGQQLDSAERLLEINGLNLEYVDRQGPDRLDNFNNYRPNEVVSALANRQPVSNGDYIPRGSNIVLGVRAP
jgi:serine/threonine-protein kinase